MWGNQQQQQRYPMIRSINRTQRSFVKFINKTLHNVVLYWIDYQGQAVSFGVLLPDHFVNIDTFVTHPWIFVDKETNDRYTVNQSDVFFPEPTQGQRRERTNVYITLRLYTLRELSLRAIRLCLSHDLQVFQLDIPRSLQYELAAMLPRIVGERISMRQSVVLVSNPSVGHCASDNGPGSDAKRIADDDSGSSAAIRGDDGQLNARQMDSGYCLVNPARS